MQQCTFFMSISILISSVGFPRDSLVGFGIGGLPLPLIKSPPRWWMGVIVIEGLDYGSMSLWLSEPHMRKVTLLSLHIFLPAGYAAELLAGFDANPLCGSHHGRHVLYWCVARQQYESRQVQQRALLVSDAASNHENCSVCAHAKRQQIQELHESSKWTRTEATVLHGLVESLVRQWCSAWWYQMLLLSPLPQCQGTCCLHHSTYCRTGCRRTIHIL